MSWSRSSHRRRKTSGVWRRQLPFVNRSKAGAALVFPPTRSSHFHRNIMYSSDCSTLQLLSLLCLDLLFIPAFILFSIHSPCSLVLASNMFNILFHPSSICRHCTLSGNMNFSTLIPNVLYQYVCHICTQIQLI